MKFAFSRRETTETIVWVEAESELEAWERLHSGWTADEASDPQIIRDPVFRRLPKQDERGV